MSGNMRYSVGGFKPDDPQRYRAIIGGIVA